MACFVVVLPGAVSSCPKEEFGRVQTISVGEDDRVREGGIGRSRLRKGEGAE